MTKRQKSSEYDDEQVRREIADKAMATVSRVLVFFSILGKKDVADKVNQLIQESQELRWFLFYFSDTCRMECRRDMISQYKLKPNDSEDIGDGME